MVTRSRKVWKLLTTLKNDDLGSILLESYRPNKRGHYLMGVVLPSCYFVKMGELWEYDAACKNIKTRLNVVGDN